MKRSGSPAAIAGCITANAQLLASASPAAAQSVQVGLPPAFWQSVTIDAGVAVGATALAVGLMMPAVRRFYAPQPPAANLEELLPLRWIDDDNETVVCDDGVAFKVVEFEGINYSSLGPEEIESLYQARRFWLRRLEDLGDVEVIVVSERARVNVHVGEGGGNEWLAAVNERWSAGFSRAFVNRHAALLVDRAGGAALREATAATFQAMEGHGPRILRHTPEDETSPLWAFLYRYCLGLGAPGWHGPGRDLPKELSCGWVAFDPATGLIESGDGERRRYWKLIGMKSLGEEAEARMARAIGTLEREVAMFQRIQPMGRMKAAATLRKKKKNSFMFFENPFHKELFDTAEARLFDDREGYVSFEMIFAVFGDTPEEADEAAAALKSVLARARATGVTETRVVEESYWARFPRKRGEWLRYWMPRRSDVAELLPFEGTPRGLAACWWGPSPLRTMRTASGVPFAVGVHEHEREEALANAAFIGKPGSGKTTFAGWLASGAIGHFPRMRVYCFDNLDGLTVPTTAFGGRVIRPGAAGGEGLVMAPLQLEDSRENREFLVPFLAGLAAAAADRPEEVEREVIGHGLEIMMGQEVTARTLDRFVNECLEKRSAAYQGLRAWTGTGSLAGWFDGDTDSLDVGETRWVTFDMQRVLGSEALAAAVATYALHRIRTEVWVRPTPHVIFIDEAATLAAASPHFAEMARYLLRNIRKKMGAVWLAFQEPGGMGGLAEVVRNSTATLFIWRDPSADEADYADFHLTDSDMRFIRDEEDGLRHVRRGVLAVRKLEAGRESVVIDADLSRLGELLMLYRSGGDAADLLAKNRKLHGEQRCIGPYLRDMQAQQAAAV